jgi:hypothetical protein
MRSIRVAQISLAEDLLTKRTAMNVFAMRRNKRLCVHITDNWEDWSMMYGLALSPYILE